MRALQEVLGMPISKRPIDNTIDRTNFNRYLIIFNILN